MAVQPEVEVQINKESAYLPVGGYVYEELPPRPGASRFHLETGPGGAEGNDPNLLLVNAADQLVRRRVAEMTAPPIEVKTVQTKRICQLAEDPTKYVLLDAEEVRGPVQVTPIQSRGKFGEKTGSPAETLDRFLLGECGWNEGPPLSDSQLYDCGLAVAEQCGLDGDLLRRWNRILAVAVCARAGLVDVRLMTF